MKILNLVQGSTEWLAERAKYRTASEASMMMNAHPNVTRNELLHMKATGTAQEFSDYVQKNIIDNGHVVEAKARPLAESVIGEELFPLVGVDDNGYLLASFDGSTMMMNLGWECKSWNEAKADKVRNNEMPEGDKWQVVEQLLVSGSEKILYMVTDGTGEKTVSMWVYPNADDFKALMAGWTQFDTDLASYEPHDIKPAAVAETVKELPAVTVHVKGELTLCNLADVTPEFDKFLDNAIVEFKTDDDFANAEAQSKVARKTAKKCDDVAQSVIDQMLTVSDAIRTLREYRDKFNAMGLQQEKAVKEEKKRIKEAMMADGKAKYTAFLAEIEAELSPIKLIVASPDFASKVKNKRTLESLHNAVDSELAAAKIRLNDVAQLVRTNLKTLNDKASDYRFLFNDVQQIIHTDSVGFEAIVEQRVSFHKLSEEKRLADERERIAAEEKEKAEAAANKRADEEAAALAAEVRAEERLKIQQEKDEEQAIIDAQEQVEVEASPAAETPAAEPVEINTPAIVGTEPHLDAVNRAEHLARYVIGEGFGLLHINALFDVALAFNESPEAEKEILDFASRLNRTYRDKAA